MRQRGKIQIIIVFCPRCSGLMLKFQPACMQPGTLAYGCSQCSYSIFLYNSHNQTTQITVKET